MNDAGHPPTRPDGITGPDDPGNPEVATKVRTLRDLVVLCLSSLAVMAPWPLVAILLTRPLFDNPDEVILLFGGITMIPLAILTVFGFPPSLLGPLVIGAWCAAAVVPNIWFARRLTSWRAICSLLAFQTAFSFAQAAVGAMMILGKNV